MTDKDSTILVMGPPGAGKSEFINRLAGSTKLRPNGVSIDVSTKSPRTITVSPYFTEGKTIKLVKFPGFNDESGTNLTDVELFIGIATFLDSFHHGKEIRSIIYLHPADRSKAADVDRNIKMLEQIGQGAVKNIVVVITGRDQIPDTGGDSTESKWLGGLTGQGLGKALRYDGSKLSALIILETAMKKPLITLDLKNKIPWRTDAGRELNQHIHELMKPKEKRDDELVQLIEEEDDLDKVTDLEAEQKQLKDALSRMDDERKKLGDAIDWEQAKKDNEALEHVIKEQRDSATKDWKAVYGKLEEENKSKVAEYNSLLNEKNAKVAEYNSLLNEKNALQTRLDPKPHFSIPIWATCDYVGEPGLLPHKKDQLFYTNGHKFALPGSGWVVYSVLLNNTYGNFGAVYASYFRFYA